jgi:hypothetical protein
MAVTITILPSAYGSGGPLEEFATRLPGVPGRYAKESVRLEDAEPGFIASAPRLKGYSNIKEDGTFPVAFATAIDQIQDLMVHVSPTSGSSVVRGASAWVESQAEFDPTYGLNVTSSGVQLQNDVFETALNEPVGSQFKANLQDLISRGIILVHDHLGATMDPGDIADYTAP